MHVNLTQAHCEEIEREREIRYLDSTECLALEFPRKY